MKYEEFLKEVDLVDTPQTREAFDYAKVKVQEVESRFLLDDGSRKMWLSLLYNSYLEGYVAAKDVVREILQKQSDDYKSVLEG